MWIGADSSETQPHQPRGAKFISKAQCGVEGTGWIYNATEGTIQPSDVVGMCVGYYMGTPWAMPSLKQIVKPVNCTDCPSDWSVKFNSFPIITTPIKTGTFTKV